MTELNFKLERDHKIYYSTQDARLSSLEKWGTVSTGIKYIKLASKLSFLCFHSVLTSGRFSMAFAETKSSGINSTLWYFRPLASMSVSNILQIICDDDNSLALGTDPKLLAGTPKKLFPSIYGQSWKDQAQGIILQL